MSKKDIHDFDEWSDPTNPRVITVQDVRDAADRIKEDIAATPCIPSHRDTDFGMRLYYKTEFIQRTGSFKERGALNLLLKLPADKKKLGVISGSIGNHATGLCYHASRLGIPATVTMPSYVPIQKLEKCHNLGATVIVHGTSLLEARTHARFLARERGSTYINGRDHPHMMAGFGTVALELLEQVPLVDAVIVPVGCGGLLASICTVVKQLKPNCLVYGVVSEKSPVFYKSLEMGEPVTIGHEHTLAESTGVTYVGYNAFHIAKRLVDKMLMIKEDWIARAILHLVEAERFVVEGAGACTLATIMCNLVPELKTKTVVCILSGGNIDTAILSRCLERGLAAEGRLIKFKVDIKDTAAANIQLLKMICEGGYNVIRQFPDRVWAEGDIYTVELKLVCEAKDLQHALLLKRMIEQAYPRRCVFETEPFNDDRLCPCSSKKC